METVAPLVTALVSISMAISTLIRNPRDRLHRLYTVLAIDMSVIYFCLFSLILSKADVWRYGLLFSALLVAPLSLQYYVEVLHRYNPAFRRFIPLLFTAALAQAIAIAVLGIQSTTVIINGCIVFGGLTLHLVGIWRLMQGLEKPVERNRILYLVVAGTVAVVAMALEMAVLDWNLWNPSSASQKVPLPPLGSLATAAYIYFLGQVTIRNRLLDRLEIISRITVFLVMTLVLGMVYGVVVLWLGPETGPFAEAVNILLASVLVLILYEPVKIAVEDRVVRLLARERFETVRALTALKRRLPGIIEIGPVLDALGDPELLGGRVDLSSLYLYDEFRGGYRLRRWDGDPEHALLPAIGQRPFIDGFLEGRSWYLLAELEREVERPTVLVAAWLGGAVGTLRSLQADLCLPLQIGQSVLGFWNLRLRPGSTAFAEEELVLLHDIAAQAAVLIDNSKAFERLKERDRLATLGEMSAGLAHEIRNPLGAIKGAVQILARSVEPTETKAQEFLGIIVEEVDRLNTVVGQFLDYARPMTMHVDPWDPDLLLRSVMSMVEAEGVPEDVRVVYDPERGVPPVPMDMEQIKQVLLNLLRNGIESMTRGGGKLRVSTRSREAGEGEGPVASLRTEAPSRKDVRVKRGSLRERACVEIVVEDQGEGIRPEDASKLFIPFFTTKTRGTGLGLAICERIIRQHGGEIEIASLIGEGTRFTVRLPLEDPPSADAPAQEEEAEAPEADPSEAAPGT